MSVIYKSISLNAALSAPTVWADKLGIIHSKGKGAGLVAAIDRLAQRSALQGQTLG